jgi:hypothetical protein
METQTMKLSQATALANVPEPNPAWSILFVGDADPCSGYGIADGRIKLHIFARDGEVPDAPPVPGNAPFTVKVKVNGALVRTVTEIPACADYAYTNQNPALGPVCEYNAVIENIPSGKIELVIEDALLPVPNDWRGPVPWKADQPPYATINGTVWPNGLETSVAFEFGESAEYGMSFQFGIVNGHEPVQCSVNLRSGALASPDPKEVLKPGTLYHYRVVATNAMGTSPGEDMAFVTPTYASAPVAVTMPATGIA